MFFVLHLVHAAAKLGEFLLGHRGEVQRSGPMVLHDPGRGFAIQELCSSHAQDTVPGGQMIEIIF